MSSGWNCAVKGCKNPPKSIKTHQLFRFPNYKKDLDRLYLWIKATGNDKLHQLPLESSKNWKICHRHFTEADLNWKGTLQKTAIPTLNLPTEQVQIGRTIDLEPPSTSQSNLIPTENLHPTYATQRTSFESSPAKIRNLVLHTTKPLLIKSSLNWSMLNWDLSTWIELLGDTKMEFRSGLNKTSKEPQWEQSCFKYTDTFTNFITNSRTETKHWAYFDYKHLNSFKSGLDLDWEQFGFSEMKTEDSTVWIGSKGAHTPCHVDSYGCNLIAQVYGRKRWLLFPPEADLKPTRIPYEESSIYSSLNFFGPVDLADFSRVKGARSVILAPGDVLCVPHKWWHYVENLEVAISVNCWLPQPADDDERLCEAITRLLIAQFAQHLPENERQSILNVDFNQEFGDTSLQSSIDLVDKCTELCKKAIKVDTNSLNWTETISEFDFIQVVPKIQSENEFLTFLMQQRDRFDESIDNGAKSDTTLAKIINTIVDPLTILRIKGKLLQK